MAGMIEVVAASLKPPSDRFHHMDALRFIASAGIVAHHYGPVFGVETAAYSLQLFVDLFFVLSGFIIASLYSGHLSDPAAFGAFMRKRIARLAPLHIATLIPFALIGLAVTAAGLSIDQPERFTACIVPNALLIHSFGVCDSLSLNWVSWSISAEMGMYLLAPLIFLFIGRAGAGATLALIAASIMALSLIDTPERAWTSWTYDGGVLRAFPSFLFGAWLHAMRDRLATRWLGLLVWPAVLGFLALQPVAGEAALFPLIYLIAISAVAADGARLSFPASGLMAALGQLTYSLYMLHPLVRVIGIDVIGERLLRLDGATMTLWAVLVTASLVPISILSLALFEMPLRRLLARPLRRPALAA